MCVTSLVNQKILNSRKAVKGKFQKSLRDEVRLRILCLYWLHCGLMEISQLSSNFCNLCIGTVVCSTNRGSHNLSFIWEDLRWPETTS